MQPFDLRGKASGNLLRGGGIVSLWEVADPHFIPGDGLLGLITTIIRVIAYSALGAAVVGLAAVGCCCLLDGRRGKACAGRSLFWRLMH
jgi:hypothetical protein